VRKYETVFILHPTLDEEAVNANVEKFKGVIENGGGVIENVDVWGKRKLAYEIKKVNEGIYVLFNFSAEPDELPKELDRNFRISDSVIRYMIINLEE
jgi:small subunit ribosomal protein S6